MKVKPFTNRQKRRRKSKISHCQTIAKELFEQISQLCGKDHTTENEWEVCDHLIELLIARQIEIDNGLHRDFAT
jgi:NADH:ubiquinone oxidoreductase subunit C